jgi:hypothetical protein
MAASRFYLPFRPAIDANALRVVPNAKLYFYLVGTSDLQSVYADTGLITPLANPVTANAAGRWPAIYLNDSLTYRVVLKDSNDAILDEEPRYIPGFVGEEPTIPSVTAVSIEEFGGVGYTTAAAAKAGTDNRSAIQAAIDYLVDLGGGTIYYGKPHYAFAADPRALATNDITTGLDGIPLIIDGAHITFESTCGGTKIYRRAAGMADPANWSNWPLLSTGTASLKFWRGGAIFLKGQASQPTDYSSRAGVTLDGVILDGGISRGSSYGVMNNGTGDGWDLTDKGIWSDNATTGPGGIFSTGDIRIINGGGVIGFRGELLYGPNNTDCTMFIRDGILGETNASCLNPNSCNLDVDGLYCYNFNFAFEGWGGKSGRVVNATFENGVASSPLQGGKFGVGTFSSYYAPTRVTSTVTPYCHMDNIVFKNADFSPGSWLDIGKITMIDSAMNFTNGTFADGIIDTRISEVVFVTDQESAHGITFAGGDGVNSANQSIQDIKIDRVSFQRTKVARDAARLPGNPVTWYASLGPGIVIGELTGEMSTPPRYAAASSGYAVNFLSTNIQSITGYGVATQNVQTTNLLQSVANSWRGPFVGVTTTGANVYAMYLPTTGFIEGSELTIRNDGPGQIYIDGNGAGGSGSGLRDKQGPVWLPITETLVRFRFDGSFWTHVSGGDYTAVTTVGNLPAAGAIWQNIRLMVTDSNTAFTAGIGAIVAAGGAHVVPVTCDGTNWRIG